ncbi:two component LuxR family transcriptional regulator [Caballeronia ptereochthonis]|uniref:Two component LuxR family transcriptional regulator n=2 Tax=Caballeronia ptereochthonis TaxID=1777144 RepID=A0A158B5P4_9BURK|nr:two component LuxR family transcriptional regulator [Caballeronia ptereochthonis]
MRAYKIRIVVAERRPVVLSGLQNWFGAHERFHIAACAGNGARLFAELASAEFDLIVLSGGIEGSEADDFALLRELRQICPDTPVVVLTDELDATALAAIQRAGASGVVSTLDEARAFERVCDRVLSGAKGIVSPLIAAFRQPADAAPTAGSNPDYGNARVNIRQFVGRT